MKVIEKVYCHHCDVEEVTSPNRLCGSCAVDFPLCISCGEMPRYHASCILCWECGRQWIGEPV